MGGPRIRIVQHVIIIVIVMSVIIIIVTIAIAITVRGDYHEDDNHFVIILVKMDKQGQKTRNLKFGLLEIRNLHLSPIFQHSFFHHPI